MPSLDDAVTAFAHADAAYKTAKREPAPPRARSTAQG